MPALLERIEKYAEASDLIPVPDELIAPPNSSAARQSGVAIAKPAHGGNGGIRCLSRGDHVEMAELLEQELRSEGDIVFDQGEFYSYVQGRGVWATIPVNSLYVRVQAFSGATVGESGKPKKISIHDQTGTIKTLEFRLKEPHFFDDVPPGIPFANGFASVTSKGVNLLPHSPEYRVRSAYPFDFEQEPQPTRFLAFLASCFEGDTDAEDKVLLLQEFAGACICGISTKYEKALFLYGKTASNGKSQALTILSSAMPENTVLSIAPHELGDQYRRAMFFGKLFNAVSELPERDLLDAESFKAFVSGDQVSGRPPYGQVVQFTPKAGHAFGVNRLPSVKDSTNGFWRRPIVIEFNRTFRPGDGDYVVNIGDSIIKAELPAIVSWFLQGAVRLLQNDRYTIPESHQAALQEWRGSSNRVRLFLSERTRPAGAGEAGTGLVALYDRYRFWCTQAGLLPLSRPKFAEELSLAGVERVRRSSGNFWSVVFAEFGGTSVEAE